MRLDPAGIARILRHDRLVSLIDSRLSRAEAALRPGNPRKTAAGLVTPPSPFFTLVTSRTVGQLVCYEIAPR